MTCTGDDHDIDVGMHNGLDQRSFAAAIQRAGTRASRGNLFVAIGRENWAEAVDQLMQNLEGLRATLTGRADERDASAPGGSASSFGWIHRIQQSKASAR